MQKKQVFIHVIEATATGTLSMAGMLASKQSEEGAEVVVIYSERPETPADLTPYFNDAVVLHKVNMSTFGGSLNSARKIRGTVMSYKECAVILHSSFAGFIGRLSCLFTGRRRRFFYIPHCISFMRKDIGGIKRVAFILLEWIGAIKNCTYIACSESERKTISRNIPFRKCLVVENAVAFPARSDNQVKRAKRVITVGGIREQKGPIDYADVAKKVASKMSDVEFVWIGNGEDQLKKTLADSNITVTGWVDRSEVSQYLNQASVYLSTARWEGMPVSIIEAMYAKLPVVASNCAGNVDVVNHGQNGWLFENNQTAADQVISVLLNESEASAVSDQAFVDAESRFSPQRYYMAMNEIMRNP